MTVDTYMLICYVGMALCLISLAITLFLFFKLNIIGVIGDLSGLTARKGIENIRNQNSITGNKAHRTSTINRERGRLTDKITPSGGLVSAGAHVDVSVGTEKFSTGKLSETEETTVLGVHNEGAEGTTVLSEETTLLNMAENDGTTVLNAGYSETTVLGVENNSLADAGIVVEDEIIFVHSDEQIR